MKRIFEEFIWLLLIGASVIWGLNEHSHRRDTSDVKVVHDRADSNFIAGSAAGK